MEGLKEDGPMRPERMHDALERHPDRVNAGL
jgi:hypothetical protein